VDEDNASAEIRKWLMDNHYEPEEINKVMERVTQYDQRTVRDSWFDSIGQSEMNLRDIIRQVLGKEKEK